MAVGIPTGFVRKLYRILDHESAEIISWDSGGASFSIHDSAALDAQVLPRYFRGRLCAFRQQLVDHGFTCCDCEEDETREQYKHADFIKGQPGRLSNIERKPKRGAKTARKTNAEVALPVLTSRKSDETTKPRISLKVTLTVPPRKRDAAREQTGLQTAKRPKTTAIPHVAATTAAKNPLFSDDPEPGAMTLAKFVEGAAGLLPASSELPDPISYLNKNGGGGSVTKETQQDNNTVQQTASIPPMFSDDMVKSALFFLTSTSCTGIESNHDETSTGTTTVPAEPALPTAMTTSTSSFLAALLASSSTGATTGASFARGSNPLFSDQTADGDDDSIWNILVASSVDRARSAIDGVDSPQERLRLILEERERLEEQRKKVGAPAEPIVPRRPVGGAPQVSGAIENSRPQKQQNPLFATEPSAGLRTGVQKEPAEDDLWMLLMSSSIDSFRRVTDLGL